jgi:hypothetical protein
MGAAASGVSIGVLRLASKGALPQTLDGLRISTQVGGVRQPGMTSLHSSRDWHDR